MNFFQKLMGWTQSTEKKWIIIIEDNKILSDMYKYKLELEWYKVSTADNWKKWLKLIMENNFDLVLLDIMMPEMNWIELLEELLKIWKEATVFVFSNLNNEAQKSKAFALWAKDYIVKSSLTPRELIQKIKSSIG